MTTAKSEAVREHLLLESILAGTNIAIGLTAIRRYDFTDKGQFFAGMSAFTTGLERLLKLTIVLDHALTHGSLPTNTDLKSKFRHRLDDLFEAAGKINEQRGFGINTSAIDDPLSVTIRRILTKFASATRYYNLDFVTGATLATDKEPLQEWTAEVCCELLRRHHRWTRQMKEDVAFANSYTGVRGIVVGHVGDDGSAITDLAAMAREGALAATKQKYSVLYLHQLLMFCIDLLEALDALSGPLGVSEVFRYMWCTDRRMILNRRVWQTYR
jgi:hypothetical protein